MRQREERIMVYTAEDGKKFLNMTDCIFYESHEMIFNQRKQWISNQFADFEFFRNSLMNRTGQSFSDSLNRKSIGNFYFYIDGDRTTITNIKTGRSGKAICTHGKDFDFTTGWAIAWARYKGEKIPNYI